MRWRRRRLRAQRIAAGERLRLHQVWLDSWVGGVVMLPRGHGLDLPWTDGKIYPAFARRN